jgi:acylphosphatase
LSDNEITSLRVHVHGIVQGIGFRDFLIMSAQRNNLDGWVRNRADGSVEALVSGATKSVPKAPRSAPLTCTTANRPPKRASSGGLHSNLALWSRAG